jgi:hypothetical protein
MVTWLPVPEFPDYEVSDSGLVRRKTGGKGVRAGRVLRSWSNGKPGYQMVSLYRNGVRRARTVHSIVAEVFIGPRPSGSEINHKDGIKNNNVATNLEYETSSGNKLHASRLGLSAFGERNGSAKLTDEQVVAIRAACSGGATQRTVARAFGISQPHVSDIVNGKSRVKT